MIYFWSCEYLISLNQIHAHTCYQLHVGNESPILENLSEILWNPSPKIQFSSHGTDFPHTISNLPKSAFYFLQQLSAFSNGFPNFSNGFPIFLKGFPLSKKSKKIYLRRQVYKRSPFELCISRHSLPELRNRHLLPKLCNCHSLPKLCNCHSLPELCNCYNACISPTTLLLCTCVLNSAPNLKSKLKYNPSRI